MNRDQVEAAKRELRAQIARHRRQIDRRVRALGGEASELVSWRTGVRQFPGWTVGLGLGIGWLLAGGLPRAGLTSWLLREAVGVAGAMTRQRAYAELASLWRAVSKSF